MNPNRFSPFLPPTYFAITTTTNTTVTIIITTPPLKKKVGVEGSTPPPPPLSPFTPARRQATPPPMRPLELNDGLHMSSYPWKSRLWRKTRPQRVALFRSRAQFPVAAYVLAVVELQRIWRGILLRRRVLAQYLHKDFKRLWRATEEQLGKRYAEAERPEDARFLASLKRVQARLRTCLLRREYVRWLAYDKLPVYYVAACTMQRAWRSFKRLADKVGTSRRYQNLYNTKEDACAARVQDAWRRYVNRQIYQFYVDLIKFRERGDPQMMLKCINPKEAGLIDAASGLHVRFRLGGPAFPPTIFYKIFCHGSVADICSFAPKDYVFSRQNVVTTAMRHNKGTIPTDDRSRWYKRNDNNEWRPISERILQEAESIVEQQQQQQQYAITREMPWHHTKLKRQEDVQLKVKRKRREWLKQLYTQEQMVLTMDVQSKKAVVDDASALFGSMTDAELEDEVQRLVQWTRDLDFKTYREDWLHMATTAASDFTTVDGPALPSSAPAKPAAAFPAR